MCSFSVDYKHNNNYNVHDVGRYYHDNLHDKYDNTSPSPAYNFNHHNLETSPATTNIPAHYHCDKDIDDYSFNVNHYYASSSTSNYRSDNPDNPNHSIFAYPFIFDYQAAPAHTQFATHSRIFGRRTPSNTN